MAVWQSIIRHPTGEVEDQSEHALRCNGRLGSVLFDLSYEIRTISFTETVAQGVYLVEAAVEQFGRV